MLKLKALVFNFKKNEVAFIVIEITEPPVMQFYFIF